MGQWENLHADLLIEIDKLLILYADKVRFTCVCKSWRSALPRMPQHRLPWLLHPQHSTFTDDQPTFGLFNVVDKKDYYLHLPKREKMLIRGSSHGWVVVIEEPDEIYLLNPLTGAKIHLPPRSKFPDVKEYCADNHDHEYVLWNKRGDHAVHPSDSERVHFVLSMKFLISSNPSLADDYVVVAIYGSSERLAYCRRGDEKWTELHGKDNGGFIDAIFYKGKILALGCDGSMDAFDIPPYHQQAEDCEVAYKEIAPPQILLGSDEAYLVGSSGGLLYVERKLKSTLTTDPKWGFLVKSERFSIFKLDLACSKWCRVTDIGDDVLFIGFNTSVSKSSLEFPGLQRNSIYFTSDRYFGGRCEGNQGGSEIGVFDLSRSSIELLPGYKCDSDLVWPPPIWFIPSP